LSRAAWRRLTASVEIDFELLLETRLLNGEVVADGLDLLAERKNCCVLGRTGLISRLRASPPHSAARVTH
jgi:hypothetical protein